MCTIYCVCVFIFFVFLVLVSMCVGTPLLIESRADNERRRGQSSKRRGKYGRPLAVLCGFCALFSTLFVGLVLSCHIEGVRAEVVPRRQHSRLRRQRELPLPLGRKHERRVSRDGKQRAKQQPPLVSTQAAQDSGTAPGGGEGVGVVSVPEAFVGVGRRYCGPHHQGTG